jgi:hypothetical protein
MTLKFKRNLTPVSSDYKEEPYWLAALQSDYSTDTPFSLDVDIYFVEAWPSIYEPNVVTSKNN